VKTNSELFEKAKKLIPGGVDSPVRAFGRVGGIPRFIEKGSGPYMYDAEGKKYIDYVLSWGPLILGHCHPTVVEKIKAQAERGMSFGAPTELEIEMAEAVCSAFKSIEQVRFVSSGTEATMSAIRLARGFTARDIIVKFEGCYHGHVDSLLSKAGSGVLTFGIPDTPGVPAGIASTTVVLKYNDISGFEKFMDAHGNTVAAVIVEPVAGNMGVVLPKKGFLEKLRQKTTAYGALLIFDEVITGFRFCFGGAQDVFSITPDLTCLGKIIGGGMPVGAFGGRKDIMSFLAPVGPVYQAGTLSGNPIAMAAGIATLGVLKQEQPYKMLDSRMDMLMGGIQNAAREKNISLQVNCIGSMASLFFNDSLVEDLDTVMTSDGKMYAKLFHSLLEAGVYLAPSPYEALFISISHTEDVIAQTLDAVSLSFAAL
jgi:glutamate-1-semialdehyde 2,1-aminomutase